MTEKLGAVAIGRNEGPRLTSCLKSLAAVQGHLVYVDSGSTDGSVEEARRLGAEVVILDPDVALPPRGPGTPAGGGSSNSFLPWSTCSSLTPTAKSCQAG